MLELIKNPNVNFIGKRNIAFSFSGLLVFLGILAIVMISLGKTNLGIDFSGGTSLQIKFEQPIHLDQARSALERNGIKDPELQQFALENRLLVGIKKAEAGEQKMAERISDAFLKEFPSNKFIIEGSTEIGPTVGQRLKKDAIIALTLAMLGILIYVAIRFQLKFGVAAAIATFHDVLAVLGIFFIFGKEINLLLITALLTLAGYSLTDTIVVFDRIRENLKFRQKESTEQVINRSINEVLSRTIITSTTVFLACLALFLFGGKVIHDFSLAMLLGVIVGTYSSIFVASPILIIWKGKKGKVNFKK